MSGSDEGRAERQAAERVFEVDRSQDFKIFIGGVVTQTVDFAGGVGEGNAFFDEEVADAFFME